MKEGMKMSGFLIGIVTGAVIIYCGILYVRKVEERSFLKKTKKLSNGKITLSIRKAADLFKR